MKTSKNGLNLIKQFEGCHLTSYKCPGGVWTIGYGHTNDVKAGQTISQEAAELYLRQDLSNAERYVGSYDSIYHFTQDQFDALVSFTYNAGAGNLKRRLLNYGKKPIEQVKIDLPATCIKAGGKTLPGLIRRRVAEANLMGECRKDISLVAQEALNGYWGNGDRRRKMLTDAGYDYAEVQAAINKLVRGE